MTSPDAAGRDYSDKRDIVVKLLAGIGEYGDGGIVGTRAGLIRDAADLIQSLRAQLAEKEKELTRQKDNVELLEHHVLNIEAQLEAIRKQTVEALQTCKRVIVEDKDNVITCTLWASSCETLVDYIDARLAALSSPTTAEEEK